MRGTVDSAREVQVASGRPAAGGRAVDPEVAFSWGRMVATRGRIRVERLVAEIGWPSPG